MTRKFLVTILLVFVVASCGLVPPKPVQSEFFVTQGGGFMINTKDRQIRYGIVLASAKPIPAGSFIEVQFENPAGGDPFTTTHTVTSGESQFVFKSPPVSGLKRYTNYIIEVHLYDDDTKQKLLGTHQQGIQNIIDENILGW